MSTTYPAAGSPYAARTRTSDETNRRLIRIWLYVVALVVFALVLVGGATRLTESGLSITEWKPIHGIVPPLSLAEWQEEFDLYRQIPQYQEINRGMSLEAFQTIFWWEWTHRVLARFVGVIFAVPLAIFWIAGRIPAGLKPKLLGILALGALQGAIGWWMVASGLSVRTDVSQYRLAIHLTTACIIFASTIWVARGLAPHSDEDAPSEHSVHAAGLIVFLALAQIYLGGLVAGLNAGLTFNTWPLMDGRIVPEGLLVMQPVWRNFFENVMTVQFVHRMSAYLLLAVVLVHVVAAVKQAPGSTHARRAVVLLGLVIVQAMLGITTLLLAVPIEWALLHQGGALVVLAFAVAHARGLKGPYRVPARH
ncbi:MULTISPECIES: COX15/CtaA family protein [unclassified Aureimonas]|uniref:COX15/CtaA family protein n=1 Tax=unclassified Aureimonas TaxID=2615206 RepID=UPI0006F20737|nr:MULTISPECIES: COX15/CtaA family protein [unclassified Aureimonas]KQT52991.1 heme A synthase [Aureimonas sp. Leaf427]KQT80448.1 heme A synthase [Aureimonas sp. Leaf460]